MTKKKGKLSQYRGRLTPAQVADGMNAAICNARRLADDARALFDLERYPTAASIAILSIEESGKVGILRHFAMAPDLPSCRKVWQDYRNHRRKNAAWILPDLVAAGARDLESLRPATEPGAEHTALLNNIKQIGLYSDCLGNAHWSEPEKVIDRGLAEMLVKIADLFAKKEAVTPEEIELWISHLGPVYGASLDTMKKALVGWYRAMNEAGLLEEDDTVVKGFVMGAEQAPNQGPVAHPDFRRDPLS